jgi:DNA-binding GntR family transcriptional regulator
MIPTAGVDAPPSHALTNLWELFAQNTSASDAAFETLREGILQGLLPAGMRLAEEDLAARFSVSRTPIREAMFRLESEMLVERVARRGIVVSRVTEEEILEVYVVRAVLDGLAARLAARSATVPEVMRLRMLNLELAGAVKASSLSDMAALSLEFHETLGRSAHNGLVEHFLGQIHSRLRRFGGTTLANQERARKTISEHDRILRAVEARDEPAAEQLARDHTARSMEARVAASVAKSRAVSHGTVSR